MGAERQADPKAVPLDMLRHPLRFRILEICTEWERISPSEMVDYKLCADIESIRYKPPKQSLSIVAYHCRRLAEFGFLTVTEAKGKRGPPIHYYSANVEAEFDAEEWSALTQAEREAISPVVWHRLVSQVDASMRQRLFDNRDDRWLVWGPLELDQQSWLELIDKFQELFRDIKRMQREATDRMAKSGEAPMPVTYGLLQFESPKREIKRQRNSPGEKSRHQSHT